MKKAFQISIAQTLFSVEEDAFATLESYLASIKRHFESTEGKDEIIADIENRIAEKLVEAKERVVTLASVERIIASMGRVEDFGDANAPETAASTPKASAKKLYRDPDDMIIAGVCSGLAAYFGFEPLWVRIAFVILTLINGLGILIYGILWLLIPLAKTGSQKLEMSGQPVTLGTLTEAVTDRIGELKMKERTGLRKALALPFVLIGRFVGALARAIGPVARIGIGTALVLATIFALMGLTIGTGFLFSSNVTLVEGLTLQSLMQGTLHWIVPLSFLVAALVPALFVLFAGVSLLQRKLAISGIAALVLLGIWFVALVGSGFGIAKIVTGYQDYVRSAPEYQSVVTTLPLEGTFEAVSVHGLQLRIEKATSTRLVAEGRTRDMAMIGAHVENGVLVLERNRLNRDEEFCLFCETSQPELTLYTDALNSISADDAWISSKDFPARNTIHIALDHDTYMTLSVEARSLVAVLNDGSHLSLEGKLESLETTIDRRSRLSADALDTAAAALTLDHGSSAEINASNTLTVSAQRDSSVRSIGNATVTKDVDTSSAFYQE